ncbi:MAG TPA: hypothetical protein VGA73_11700, partial [Candidatus Binatia bacterium]
MRERMVNKSAKKSRRSPVGVAVPCGEHVRFVRGAGRYTDDLFGPETLHMALLRSPYGHATLTGIDLSKSLAHPGVLDAAAHRDLAGRVGDLPMLWVIPGMRCGSFPVLAREKVRYAG